MNEFQDNVNSREAMANIGFVNRIVPTVTRGPALLAQIVGTGALVIHAGRA